MNRYLTIFLLATIIVVYNIVFNPNKVDKIYTSLDESNLIDNRFNPYLESIFSNAINLLSLRKKVSVNKNYSINDINIYGINLRKANIKKKSILGLKYLDFKELITGNLIAVKPNIILIDIHYLSFLILESEIESNKFFDLQTLAGEDYYDYSTSDAIISYLRVNRYDDFLTNESGFSIFGGTGTTVDTLASLLINSDHRSEKFLKGPDSLITLTEGLLDTLVLTYNNTPKSLNDLHDIFFLFIALHELSHLYFDVSEKFDFGISYRLKKILDSKFEETKADSIAFDALFDYVVNNKDELIFNYGFSNILDIIEIYRDIMLAKSLPKLRGIDIADLLIVIEEDTTKGSEYFAYGDINRVKKAYKESFPPLTPKEFKEFKNNLFSFGGGRSHPHIFQRSEEILKIVQDIYGIYPTYPVEPYSDIFDFVTYDNKEGLFIKDIEGEIPISFHKIIEFIAPYTTVDTAYNFSNNHTLIFHLHNNLGFIELILNPESDNSFKYLKLVCTYDIGEDGLITEETFHSSYLSGGLKKLMFKDNGSKKEKLFINKHLQFKDDDRLHLVEDADYATIKFRRLNNKKYLVTELLPLTGS